jgi:eukaryotic-like serine/threonine-protein kinase
MSRTNSPQTPVMTDESLRSDDAPTPARSQAASVRSQEPPPEACSPVDRAYREFSARREAGEETDPDEFCAQHPSMRSSLRRLVHAHVFLEQNSALISGFLEARWPEAGETFLDYRLLLLLGQGAFARVFLAAELGLGNRLVAVKISREGRAEAEVLGRIRHPNIVPVNSVQTDAVTGLTAVCMPYLGSATLCDVLDKAFPAHPSKRGAILDAVSHLPYPLDTVAHSAPDPVLRNGNYLDGIRLIGAQLAEALAFIHARGICHRDLKPSNVLLSPEGVPMLLDFNLCAEAKQALPPLGGTLPFMSPEQLRAMNPEPQDAAALDGRSDLFSLGVILYELVTETHPFGPLRMTFPTVELSRLLLERQKKGPIEARRVNGSVDARFSQLIQRCLAFDPQDRPQTAAELALALRNDLAPAARSRRWIRRHIFKMMAATVLILAAALSGIAFTATRPPWHERQFEAGLQHAKKREYREALPFFDAALQVDPTNSTALRARAHAFQELGSADAKNYDLAIRDYILADQQAPDGRNKAGLGYCLNRAPAEKTENAIEYYKKAIKAGFATAAVHNNLGYNYQRSKRPQDAKEALDRAIELDPKLQAAYHNRALLTLAKTMSPGAVGKLKPMAKNEESYRLLKVGLDDVQQAIALGSGSAELYFDAARLCALAMHVDTAWEASALQYAAEAIRLGYSSTDLADPVFNRLRQNASFKKLTEIEPTSQPLPPTERLVDPLKG